MGPIGPMGPIRPLGLISPIGPISPIRNMAPATILNKLAQVRRRERLVCFVWGAARVFAVALLLLLLCCFADWLFDRWQDTPRSLLALFLLFQLVVGGGLTLLFVVLPMFTRLSDSTMATWVERTFPGFRHRLVTAVELNRAGARVRGMSPALIAAVTSEAEQKAAVTDFTRAVDARRLYWSAYVVFPVLFLVLLPVVIAPRTAGELLARELQLPIEITRSVRLELEDVSSLPPDNTVDRDEKREPHRNIHEPALCASGDRVALRFKVAGPVSTQTTGTIRIKPEDGPAEALPLAWEKDNFDGTATFVARVPASSMTFTYEARLDNDSWVGRQLGEQSPRKWLPPAARMREVGKVELESRPIVESQKAAILLPTYCGLRPDGTRFEEIRSADNKGEVVGLSGSTAIVRIATNKPLKRAWLELLGPSQPGEPEQVLSTREMTLESSGQEATGRFDLDWQRDENKPMPQPLAYRVLVWDTFGFANVARPRRGITQLPDEPPLVTLLPEDEDTAGAPVILNNRLLVGYRATSPAGLDSAFFCYRILRSREDPEAKFQKLPLTRYKASPDVGDFDLNRGLFEKILDKDYARNVEFHALVEKKNPGLVPDEREGGGREIFNLAPSLELKSGDRIEFYVEVLDKRPAHLAGQSETRVKEVVTREQFAVWAAAKLRESQQLSELEARQREVFDPSKPAPE